MAESPSSRWWNRELAFVAAGGVVVAILAAILVDVLVPGWPHARRGAVVGGCCGFYVCMAPLLYRRLRRDQRAPDTRSHP